MAEVEEKRGPVAGRSAAYPFIPLDKALARAEALRKAIGNKADTRVVSAMSHWGYGPKSSGGIQTIAALKHFGLLEDFKTDQGRRVKLTELALRILLDQRPDSADRAEHIKRAALNPKMHQELWERWGSELPVDVELRHYLLLDRNFNENGATDLIEEYKATIAYAKLTDSDRIPPYQEDISVEKPAHEPPRKSDFGWIAETIKAQRNKNPPPPTESQSANQIKVTMDGDRLQVVANVDAKGAQKLLKAIRANLELLSDDDGDLTEDQ